MMVNAQVFVRFARVLSYPAVRMQQDAAFLLRALADQPQDANKLRAFADFVTAAKHADVEELFTRTFDMNAACCLEIGWHLYGEDYRRGEFLVRMRQSLAEENLPESGELPDHISHCLQLLTKLEFADAQEFTRSYLMPAIEKILAGFKDQDANPYLNIIEALAAVLKRRYDIRDTHHPALRVLERNRVFRQTMRPAIFS